MPTKIIIDTDPGQDDAVAILLALASPDEIDVLGITAVAGNVGLAQNAKNALKVVELSGRNEVPVMAGCPGPLRRPLVTAEHVHGQTGLDGPELPEPQKRLDPRHAVDFIVDTLRAEPEGTVTLVALGPLTNVAMALIKAPDIAPRVRQIVLMGGAYFEVGNITPAAEFNIYVDPEAADVVYRAGIPLVMAPLDLSHTFLSTRPRIDAMRALGNRTGSAVADMLSFSERFDLAKYGLGRGATARSVHHRLSAAARPVLRPADQRVDRGRKRADTRHDRRRLLADHRQAAKRLFSAFGRCRRILCPAHRTSGTAALDTQVDQRLAGARFAAGTRFTGQGAVQNHGVAPARIEVARFGFFQCLRIEDAALLVKLLLFERVVVRIGRVDAALGQPHLIRTLTDIAVDDLHGAKPARQGFAKALTKPGLTSLCWKRVARSAIRFDQRHALDLRLNRQTGRQDKRVARAGRDAGQKADFCVFERQNDEHLPIADCIHFGNPTG